MKILISLLLTFILSHSASAETRTKISSLNYRDQGTSGVMTIKLDRSLESDPELTVRDRMIQVVIPGSFVWPKIEKKISFKKPYDGKVLAYQYNKDRVRVRAKLPFNIKQKEDEVALMVRGDVIEVTFPKRKTQVAVTKKKAIKKTNVVKREQAYSDSYLEKLLKDQDEAEGAESVALKKIAPKPNRKVATPEKEDRVTVKQSSIFKEEKKDNFSLASYVGKFAGFLALILLFFYGVVTLLRKGAMKKGRLGFLNSTNIVEILGTTYVSPKKSLVLIRAHKQVFLVSNTDAGMNLISEVNDISGLMKEGEKQITGDNFDVNLGVAETLEKEFTTKEVLTEPAKENNSVVDRVKLSDQIKNKVKGLKSLQ